MPEKTKKGFAAFYLTILVLMTMAMMAASLFILFSNSAQAAKNAVKSSQSFLLAESGVEDAVFRIKKNKYYEATYQFNINGGTVSLSVSSLGSSKNIKATGDISQRIRLASAVLNTENETVSFYYGAQVGKGGISMANNTRITGNVYSNGNIIGSSSAQITGDAWVAGSLTGQVDQQWLGKNNDFKFGLKTGSIYYLDTAQAFIPAASGSLSRVSFYLKKVGSPPDQTVRILADNDSQPSKTVLGSGTLVTSKVTSDYSWIDVSLDSKPNLVSGQSYWLMIDTSRDDSNYWVWGQDDTDDYPFGAAKYSENWSVKTPVWNSINSDLNFKTWMGGEDATVLESVLVGVDGHASEIRESLISRDAYYKTIDQETQVNGIKYPNSEDPPVKDLPISLAQIQGWENMAASGGIIAGDYYPQPGAILGPVKIEGNLIFPSNSLNNPVIIAGPVWVQGDISASNNAKIKLQADAGSGFAIIADYPQDQDNKGRISLSNNLVTEDSVNGYLLFISTNKSMSNDNPAIAISNNANSNDPASIIFSLQGLIKVSNNAKFKEISGYALRLENNAEVVYEQGLINSSFSAGPGSGWTVKDWQETK